MKNEIIHKTIARILAPAPVPKKVFPIQLIKKKKIRKYTAVKKQTSTCSTSKNNLRLYKIPPRRRDNLFDKFAPRFPVIPLPPFSFRKWSPFPFGKAFFISAAFRLS
ncbi:MAG: hypothetical protein J6C34_03550 [Oscillospiraceae bacterium]|nr:hypothetical protein [Oscillospiraceae bacterium]